MRYIEQRDRDNADFYSIYDKLAIGGTRADPVATVHIDLLDAVMRLLNRPKAGFIRADGTKFASYEEAALYAGI